MTRDDLLFRLSNLKVHRQGDQRAPHKPLLLLLALARVARGQTSHPFREVELPLRRLLEAYGRPMRSQHPEYPFWRLQTDRLWSIDAPGPARVRASNTDPTLSWLREANPSGRFSDDVQALLAESALLSQAVRTLLDAHFPASLHAEILSAVGLDLEAPAPLRRRRDPAFRDAVLEAYGFACAICGFDARLGSTLVGVDAAHVRWHQYDGPDEVTNGVALCALHHRLLDRGMLTLSPEGMITVSESAHGGQAFAESVLSFHNRPLRRPVRSHYALAEPHLTWHHQEVFRGRPREGITLPSLHPVEE